MEIDRALWWSSVKCRIRYRINYEKGASVMSRSGISKLWKSIFNYLRIIFFDKKFCEKVPLINVECSWWLVLPIFCGSIRSLMFNSLKFGFIWVLVSLGWEARDRKRTSESPTRGEMERRRYPHHLKLWQNW